MKLETMKIEDYEQIYSLWINTPGMGLNTVDDSREGIRKYLERNPRTCFVARESGRIIGAVLSGHDGRRGYIHHTAVSEEFRRRGTGRKLVERAIEALAAEGIKKAAFVVFKQNIQGNAFWEKLGFTERDDLVYRNRIIGTEELIRIDT